MILSDIYNQLAYGELRELALGGMSLEAPSDGVFPENYKRLLPHIQMGLTSLHTKCALKEGSITIPLVLAQAVYVIKPGVDAPTDWTDNLLTIERVYGIYLEKEYEIPLDDLNDSSAIRKTSAETLVVPTDTELAPWLLETTELIVKYRANHPVINPYIANAVPLAVEIDLPVSHLEALCYFIASRIHNPIGMTPGAMHEGNNYTMKYEAAVQGLNNAGLEQRSTEVNTGLARHGWP
jgi:hypothetical protein